MTQVDPDVAQALERAAAGMPAGRYFVRAYGDVVIVDAPTGTALAAALDELRGAGWAAAPCSGHSLRAQSGAPA